MDEDGSLRWRLAIMGRPKEQRTGISAVRCLSFAVRESLNMIVIEDRNSETNLLPVAELLIAVLRHTAIAPQRLKQKKGS